MAKQSKTAQIRKFLLSLTKFAINIYVVPERAKYASRIYQILGFGIWFPIGQDYLRIITKELSLSDINYLSLVIQFYCGYVLISIGYKVLKEVKDD